MRDICDRRSEIAWHKEFIRFNDDGARRLEKNKEAFETQAKQVAGYFHTNHTGLLMIHS